MMSKSQYSYRYQRKVIDKELMENLLAELPDFISEFMNDKMGVSKFQPSTALEYTRNIKSFFEYLTSPGQIFESVTPRDISLDMLNSITYRQVMDYLVHITDYRSETTNKHVSNEEASKARKLSAIRSLYKYLLTRHLVSNNPCFGIDTPKVKEKPIIVLNDTQREALLDSLSSGTGLTPGQLSHNKEHQRMRDYVIGILGLCTGLRVSEIVGLDIDDISDMSKSLLVNRKGNKWQNVYIDDELLSLLHDYIDNYRSDFIPTDDERAIFLNKNGYRISVRSVELIIKKYANAALGAGNRITPHKLRSTYATNLYNDTSDIYLVADVLGHSEGNIQVAAKHYAKMSESKKKQAVVSPSQLSNRINENEEG